MNPYCFVQALFERAAEDETIVTGDATACITTFQAARLTRDQRLFSDSGCAPMGFDLPAAIGACIAQDRRRVVCLAGDGSIMLNVQELQTIAGLGLPIKIFVLNNSGYLSIRLTQRNFFPDNPVGAGPESGVTFPDFERLAYGFGIPFCRCDSHAGLRDAISATLEGEGPQDVRDRAGPGAAVQSPGVVQAAGGRADGHRAAGGYVPVPAAGGVPGQHVGAAGATVVTGGRRCAGAPLGHETCPLRDVPFETSHDPARHLPRAVRPRARQ